MNKYGVFIFVFTLGLGVSAFQPHDYFTWTLEVFPAILGAVILGVTYPRFKFSDLAYILMLIHSYILFVGGHYTYAEVPLFNWIKEAFHFARNDYDKVGHFAQGFVPAMIMRELLIRKSVVKRGPWLSFLVLSVCGTVSALYELLEWAVAIFSGQSADAFLGTQGDPWDTQSDMLFALIGASVMLMFFSKAHDQAITKVEKWRE